MKKIKIYVLLVVLSAMLLLTGCNYEHELKNLDILTAVGIDKNNSRYEVYAQVLKADQAVSESYGESYRYFTGEGYDFSAAVDKIYSQGSGELAFAHNKLYLLGYSALEDIADFKSVVIDSTYDIRPQSYCVIVKNDMKYFMTATDEYGFDCCYKLLEILRETEDVPRLNDIILALESDKKTVLIPVAEVSEGNVSIVKWLAVDSTGIHSGL
jgi:hypothetical protein